MTAAIVLALPGGSDYAGPGPAEVLAMRVSAAEVVEAARITGLLPDGSYLAGDLRLSSLPVLA